MRADAQRTDDFERRFLDRGLSGEQVAQMRQLWLNAGNPAEGCTLEASPDMSLGYAFKAALAPVRFLLKMRWQFLVSKGEPFITGDTPVTKSNDRIRPAPRGHTSLGQKLQQFRSGGPNGIRILR